MKKLIFWFPLYQMYDFRAKRRTRVTLSVYFSPNQSLSILCDVDFETEKLGLVCLVGPESSRQFRSICHSLRE